MDTNLLAEKGTLPLELDRQTNERLQQFAKNIPHQQGITYAACTLPVAPVDPLACLAADWQSDAFQYYWEKPAEHFSIAGGEELVALSASGSDRFADIDQQQQSIVESTATFSATPHSYAGLMFLGGFSFFDEIKNSAWEAFQPASFTVPKWIVFKDDKYTFVTVFIDLHSCNNSADIYETIINRLGDTEQRIVKAKELVFSQPESQPTENSGFAQLTKEYDDWTSSVNKAKEAIDHHTFKKIVLARQFSVPQAPHQHPADMLHVLRQQYPNCSCFLIHPPKGNSFLGATPEQLVSFQQNLLYTEALAGSMQRGQTSEEDEELENDLSFSSKNRQEHQFVVQDIEQRLYPFAKQIQRGVQPAIKKLSNVQHLYTPIRAQLKPDTDILAIVEQLHPTPAVGGYPWKQAAPYIQQLEDFERGWYAGPVGWYNASGSGEFAVAIRSGLLNKDQAHFFAGCGIVADSDPQAEWEETNLKLKPMLTALQYD